MQPNRSIPAVEIIPVLLYTDVAEAAEWLCAAFGFNVRLRIATHRIQLNAGDGAIVVAERGNRRAGSWTMMRVADVDAHHKRAEQAGARIINPPTDYPYGERQYSAEDIGGHVWTFSQSIADVDPAEWGGEAGAL